MSIETPTAEPKLRITTRQMELRGVRVHNLKEIDLDIPLGRLVVVSGVSGSGKSSLAFDTLFAEGQRRYIESFSIAARQHLERFDRPNADRIAHVPPAVAIRSDHVHHKRPDPRSTVATVTDILDSLRMLFARVGRIVCPDCQIEVRANSTADVVQAIEALPAGTRCQLLFTAKRAAAPDDDFRIWIARGFTRAIWEGLTHDLSTRPAWPRAAEPWLVVDRLVAGKSSPDRIAESANTALREGAGQCALLIDVDAAPSRDETSQIDGRNWKLQRFNRRLICSGCQREFLPVEPRLFSHLQSGACLGCRGTGRGSDDRGENIPCVVCQGSRFRDEARAVKIAATSISDLCHQTPAEAVAFVLGLNESLSSDERQLTELIRIDLARRIRAVDELGMGYLTLDRAAETLSGGETRRLMLAALIGSRITGTLIVVDEPSSGLTTLEMPHVIAALRQLQSLRNSVVVVDHSPIVIAAADHVIELGPGAGPLGGTVVYQGPPLPMSAPAPSRTSRTSEGKPTTSTPAQSFRLTQGNHHHLHNFEVEFLLGRLNVVTGPSGSGKTSLVTGLLYPAMCQQLGQVSHTEEAGTCELTGGESLVETVLIDQSPLTRSSRSNPATWLEVFDEIRQTFAATMDAKQRGFTAQHFSFNSSSGRCRSCRGTGSLKHDMQFLPDMTLVCPECGGTRYRREILDVKYRGRSIAEVLAMTVTEAAVFFRSQPRVQYRFQLLKQIGLDYLVLGQPSDTLSGGEAQRLKLAARLAVANRGPSLIICDEPTTGLHPSDTVRLISCVRDLIANGHTLVMADTSPELINAADRVIEMHGR